MTQLCKSFTSEQSSRLRQRNDFVGKRILCLTKSFDIPTPSPAQLSSSLWMPDTIEALRDVAAGKMCGLKGFKYPAWCPKHHHHHSQDDSQDFTELINQSLHSGARGLNFIDSLPEQHDQASSSNKRSRSRLSVRKTSLPRSTKGSQTTSRKDEYMRNVTSPLECKDSQPSGLEYFLAHDCELCGEESKKKCQDSHILVRNLPWRLGTIRAASSRDIGDKSFSFMIEFDHFDRQQRDWYQLWNTSSEENGSGEYQPDTSYCSTGNESTSEQNNSLNIGNQKVFESSPGSSTNNHQTPKYASSTKTQSSSGLFHAVLVESSIGCILRSNTPLGDERLWPALVFEPLIDELGIFDAAKEELKAVEYLDPSDEKLVDQSDCDIAPIIASLKSGYADFCRLQSTTSTSTIQSPPRSITTHSIDLSKPRPTNDSETKTNDCTCWSPRVEFVPGHKLFNVNNDQSREEGPQSAADNSSQGDKLVSDPSSIALSSSKLNTFNKYLQLFFQARSFLAKQNNDLPLLQDAFLANDLTQTIARYPSIYKRLKDWHLYQDAQFLLGNDSTAPLLVGNRVKVYRCSGATHWYTAVILSYDERNHLLTLIDDTVLERHQEDPTLLEMHFLDEKLVHSFIVGDAAVTGRRNSQSWRPRPQRAAKNPKLPNSASLLSDSRNGINKTKPKQTSSKNPNFGVRLVRSPLPDGLIDQQVSSISRTTGSRVAKLTSSDGESSIRARSRNVKLASGDSSLVDDMFPMPRLSAFKALKSRCVEQRKLDYTNSIEYLTSDSLPSIKSAENQKLYTYTKPNVTLEGRNFLSHRLRLEAIDKYAEASECSNRIAIPVPPLESDFRPIMIKTDLKPLDTNTSTGGVRSDDSSTSLQASRFLSSTDSSSRTSTSLNVQLRFLDDAIAKQDEET